MSKTAKNKTELQNGIPVPEGETNLIDTDYVIGQDNIKGSFFSFNLDLHGKVFLISSFSIVAFIVFTLIFPQQAATIFSSIKTWIINKLDWFFLSASDIYLLAAILIAISPLGKVRLGGNKAKADYSYLAWFAMLFAAGMGIGLMFYGVAEPISHFTSSFNGVSLDANGVRSDWSPLNGAKGDIEGATRLSMAATMYHWSLHAWGVYAIVALALALYTYNKGLPLTIRSIFYPVFGEKVWGWRGDVVDILAVFATLFGLTTSLGLGAEQAASGLHYLFGITPDNTTKIILIIVITAIALFSVVAGIEKGVKNLSVLNMILAIILLLFIIFAGPTLTILKITFTSLFDYSYKIIEFSNPIGRTDTNFMQGWSSFYWAWWISWSPFVGMFIARVSRGRSVREFLFAVLIVPTIVVAIWMSSFGGAALSYIAQGANDIQNAALELKLFALLEHMPYSGVMSLLAIILVIIFFITSSDSGSLVIDSITAGGKLDAPIPQRIFWASTEGLVAIALLLGGGLNSIQAMVIATGFPFAIIVLIMVYSIVIGLIREPRGKAVKNNK